MWIDADLKAAAKARAAERGETVTAVVVRGLREYLADTDPEWPDRPRTNTPVLWRNGRAESQI